MKARNRNSFVSLVKAEFAESTLDYELIVDRIFELFALLLVHGDASEKVDYVWNLASDVEADLHKLHLSRSHDQSVSVKASILWRCYYEAEVLRKVTNDQESLASYIQSDINPQSEGESSRRGTFQAWQTYIRTGMTLVVCAFVLREYASRLLVPALSHKLIVVLSLLVLSFFNILLALFSARRNVGKIDVKSVSFGNKLNLMLWQSFCCLPLYLWIFVTWLAGPILRLVPCPHKEKAGEQSNDDLHTNPEAHISITLFLSRIARAPIFAWRKWLNRLELSGTSLDRLDSQLAFWEMQRQAAIIGVHTGRMIARLYADAHGQLDSTRLHLIGHSFGGVVIANAARYISRNQKTPIKIHSACFLLPAINDKWLASEPLVTNAVIETLTCIYSKHDSANGLYYPIANQGFYSAGYSGFRKVTGLLQTVAPPVLSLPPYLNPHQETKKKQILNVDASLLINQGGLAVGGAHNDIFTDEVIMLIWAATAGASIHISDPIRLPNLSNRID